MRPVKPLPNWAKRERTSDLAWIHKNSYLFWPAALEQYKELGRGAIVTDTTSRPLGTGHPYTYLTKKEVDARCDTDVQRLVRQYDPETEIVVVLLKENDKVSSYRLKQVGHG